MSIPAFFIMEEATIIHATVRGITAAWSEEVKLDVTIPAQQQTNWCWSAVAVGIADAYHDAPADVTTDDRQCRLASSVVGFECCPVGTVSNGNVPQELDEPLRPNLDAKRLEDALKTPQCVRDNIRRGHPIAVRLRSDINGAGHFVVIYGYRSVGSTFMLHVQDPHGAILSEEPFDEFLNNRQQSMSWHVSYQTKGTHRSRVPAL